MPAQTPPKSLSRRGLLRAAGLGAAALALPKSLRAAANAGKPNIIFFLTDDLGWGDPRCFGHPYMKTPNIDRLARGGTVFTQFYVNNPVCSPSRTAFMTGHFPARHRIHEHLATPQLNKDRGMPNWLDPDVTTVPDVLKQAGYVTAHFGKWHLGGGSGAPAPADYGIDDSRAVNANGPTWDEKADPFFRAHSTGLFVDETLRFIKAHPGKPFYVNLWTLVPHATLKPTPEEMKEYEDLRLDPDRFKGYMPKYLRQAPNMLSQMKVFCAAVTGLDKALGRLLDELDSMGMAENTLILFSSDNGPEDYHIGNAKNAGVGCPGPHRGRKRSLYEGGVRTSCIARWPAKVPAGRRDETSVLTGVDWLPTVCALAGVPLPDIRPDGEDVSDVLTGAARTRRTPIYWEWRGNVAGDKTYCPPPMAIREGNYKLLIRFDGGGAELYDIPADPGETKNLAAQHPDIVRKLSDKLLAWKKTLPE